MHMCLSDNYRFTASGKTSPSRSICRPTSTEVLCQSRQSKLGNEMELVVQLHAVALPFHPAALHVQHKLIIIMARV